MLAQLPGVEIRDRGAVRSGIVTFTRAGEPAAALASRLRSRDANVSVTVRAAAPKDPHLRLLDGAVRASVHYYNTSDEIARFAELVAAG